MRVYRILDLCCGQGGAARGYQRLGLYVHGVDKYRQSRYIGDEFTQELKQRNFDYYDPLTTGDSSLSTSVQSIVASGARVEPWGGTQVMKCCGMKRAMAHGATAIIIVHNHPSGDPTPSEADIDMTYAIKASGEPFGIVIHDHLIVSKNGTTSFKTSGLI